HHHRRRPGALDARPGAVHLRDVLPQLPPRLRRGDELAPVRPDLDLLDPPVPIDARQNMTERQDAKTPSDVGATPASRVGAADGRRNRRCASTATQASPLQIFASWRSHSIEILVALAAALFVLPV